MKNIMIVEKKYIADISWKKYIYRIKIYLLKIVY